MWDSEGCCAGAKSPRIAVAETLRYVGRAVAYRAGDPRGAFWGGKSVSGGELAQVCGFTHVDGPRPDRWRYMREVQDPGTPADVTNDR